MAGVSCKDDPSVTEPFSHAEVTSPETPSLAVTANSWVTRANIPSVQRQGFATAPFMNSAKQYVVYMIGGATAAGASLSNNLAYNVSTNTWAWMKPLPAPLYHTNGIGVIGGKLYISGGIAKPGVSTNALYMYDPVANTWTQKAAMPKYSYGGVSGVINNKLYVYTNCDSGEGLCEPEGEETWFYRYDPVTNQWTTLARPKTAHIYGTGGATGGKFYLAGGWGSELEVYDPASNTWSSKAPLPTPRRQAASAMLQGKLYVVGGFNETGVSRANTVYDPATNQWTEKAPLPADHANFSASAVALDGQLRMEVLGGAAPNNLAYLP
jgi:N-acetylneuraminic acid mutarotase